MKNGEKKMRIRDRLETIVKTAIASEAESLKEINDVINLIIKKQDKLNKASCFPMLPRKTILYLISF